jgi:hypothetical protein
MTQWLTLVGGVLGGCFLVSACTKPEAGGVEAGVLPLPVYSASVPPEDAPSDGPREAVVGASHGGADLSPFATGRPIWGKSVGHTSVVFKLRLIGGTDAGAVEAAYKPRSKRGKTRYRGEIAAYRLGLALGLVNVPPALSRTFPVADLAVALGGAESEAGKLFVDEVVADDHGEVRGAIIPWIHGLKFVSLEAEPLRSEWRGWLLRSEPVPEEKRKLAAQISTMIVFDYLTGNWDRWSGGNIGADETGETLLYIDNDGAFFDPPPPEPLARQRALLREDGRFSKNFVAALRALHPAVAKVALGEDAPGEALLSPKVLAGLEERRQDALAIVDAKLQKDGQDKVLAFE